MNHHLHRQIDKLKQMILSQGALVEQSLEQAVRSVETQDPALAELIVDQDRQIDQMEQDIEEECLHVLALYQPVAINLRWVVAVLKISDELEQVAALSVEVARSVSGMGHAHEPALLPSDLREMTAKVRAMLAASLDALVNSDTDAAWSVRQTDDLVDRMHRQMYQRVDEQIRSAPLQTRVQLLYLSISRSLERIADHICNIAEDVLYMAKGDIFRHAKKRGLVPAGRVTV